MGVALAGRRRPRHGHPGIDLRRIQVGPHQLGEARQELALLLGIHALQALLEPLIEAVEHDLPELLGHRQVGPEGHDGVLAQALEAAPAAVQGPQALRHPGVRPAVKASSTASLILAVQVESRHRVPLADQLLKPS